MNRRYVSIAVLIGPSTIDDRSRLERGSRLPAPYERHQQVGTGERVISYHETGLTSMSHWIRLLPREARKLVDVARAPMDLGIGSGARGRYGRYKAAGSVSSEDRPSHAMSDRTRIYFATDIHGSQRCWMKFINAAAFYEADVLIMGGDFTGKMIVPLVKTGKKKYRVELSGKTREVHERDVTMVERQILDSGFYAYRTDPEEMDALRAAPASVEALFLRLMEDRISRWLDIACERLSAGGVRCFFGAGNDDPPEIDELLDGYAAASDGCLVHCNERVVELTSHHQMISVGNSNETPWKTPRETSEEELEAQIEKLVGDVLDVPSCIFNLHVPPYQSRLDDAPELDDDFRPVTHGGQVSMAPVGSIAVRNAIERHQPLLALHGHIHESKGFVRLGRTVCINPGSEYGDGILDGAVLDLNAQPFTYTLVSG